MGNYTSKTRDEWIKESIGIIKHKFGKSKIKDDSDKEIEWNEVEYYLGILYDVKYNGLNLKKFNEITNPKINPGDLDAFI